MHFRFFNVFMGLQRFFWRPPTCYTPCPPLSFVPRYNSLDASIKPIMPCWLPGGCQAFVRPCQVFVGPCKALVGWLLSSCNPSASARPRWLQACPCQALPRFLSVLAPLLFASPWLNLAAACLPPRAWSMRVLGDKVSRSSRGWF